MKQRSVRLVGIILTCLVFLTNLAHGAATYFVSPPPSGNDANPGTSALPFATIQHAANLVNPGDTVTVRAGTYVGAKLSRSGSAALRIVFHGEAGAIVSSAGSLNSNGDNLWIRDASYITVEGFEVLSAPRAGIAVQAEPPPGEAHGVIVQNNNCHNNTRWGVFTAYAEGIVIQNNITSFSGVEHGIYVSNTSDNPVIKGNTVHHNNASGIQINADPALDGDGIISNALIDSNIIYENGVAGAAGINLASVINSTISNNLLYNNHAGGLAGWDDGFCPCGGGFTFGTHNNKIYNNTMVQASDGRFVISLLDGSTGNEIKNNILIHPGTRGSINLDSTSETGLDSDYNAVVNVFSANDGDTFINLAQWQARGHDLHSFVSNNAALFVDASINNYHLKSTSPAINSGTPLAGVTVDLEGVSRPQGSAYDVGAYEALLCAGDTTAPTTSITQPINNDTVSGTITVSANASDDCQVARVEFYVDGNIAGTDTQSPYSVLWDSRLVPNGSHALKSRAFDAANHSADSLVINVTVSNNGLFFDDFSDGSASDWTFGKGTWTVSNQQLMVSFSNNATATSPNFGACSQCTFEADILIQSQNSRAGIRGWYQSASTYVEVLLMDDKNKIQLLQKSNGTNVIKQTVNFTLVAGQTYHVLATYGAGAFLVQINGGTVINKATPAAPSGRVALSTAKGAAIAPVTARFDNISVH